MELLNETDSNIASKKRKRPKPSGRSDQTKEATTEKHGELKDQKPAPLPQDRIEQYRKLRAQHARLRKQYLSKAFTNNTFGVYGTGSSDEEEVAEDNLRRWDEQKLNEMIKQVGKAVL